VALQKGDLIHSRYRLVRLLGRGTSGAVWAARNELIDRDVALKILDPEVAADEVLLQRFFNEAKSIGRVNHLSIVGILDLGQAEDGSPFLVLELLDGEPLSVRIMRDGTVNPEALFDVCGGVAKALDLAHQQGIIHRDMKPANIFLHRTSAGPMLGKILDFGISKVLDAGPISFSLTRTGTVVGSPAYMSPEQASGRDDIDGRADVWSLGVVLFEALTGTLPHEAPNYNALMVRILSHDPDSLKKIKPSVPDCVCRVVDSCLQRNREARPTAGALSAMMEATTRELRAARFQRTGGRRRGDQPATNGDDTTLLLGLPRRQLFRTVFVGASSGFVTALVALLIGYVVLLW
jgi:serine/threonine protein kinase